MLHGRHMLPTIPASDLARARAWYADKLGFTTGQEEAEALLYRSGDDRVFLLFSSAGAGTAHHQLAAWVVEDLQAGGNRRGQRGYYGAVLAVGSRCGFSSARASALGRRPGRPV